VQQKGGEKILQAWGAEKINRWGTKEKT